MKLLRYGPRGAERPALLDREGRVRDLSAHVSDLTPEILSPSGLQRLAALDVATLPIVEVVTRYGMPFVGAGKFLGIGLNYSDHATDKFGARPAEPVIFSKAISCLNGPNDDVVVPLGATKMDWEVELGVVFGRVAHYVKAERALDTVAGYMVVNDLSERGFQNASGQWDKGKGCDTFGPIGPWLVTQDEIPDPQSLDLWLDHNGRRMQTGTTANMIYTVAELIANVSRYITLQPGDILITGTPRGVGADQAPEPVFLRPGDRLSLGVAGLGEQQQKVIGWDSVLR